VWDDWGGFYDHVAPQNAYIGGGSEQNGFTCTEAPNDWGCGYTYGFRVPFLVVSEYTGGNLQNGSYISGACGPGQPVSQCPNLGPLQIYQHDFGSILAFTEFNFDLLNIDQSGNKGYADYNALDWGGPQHNNVPLSDFSSFTRARIPPVDRSSRFPPPTIRQAFFRTTMRHTTQPPRVRTRISRATGRT